MMGKKEHSDCLHSTVEGTVEYTYKGPAWWGGAVTQQVDTNLGKRGRRMLKILRCSLGGGSTSLRCWSCDAVQQASGLFVCIVVRVQMSARSSA